jgi:hypothetical protein
MYEPFQWRGTVGQPSAWRGEFAACVQAAAFGSWRKKSVDLLDELLIKPPVYADSSSQIP